MYLFYGIILIFSGLDSENRLQRDAASRGVSVYVLTSLGIISLID